MRTLSAVVLVMSLVLALAEIDAQQTPPRSTTSHDQATPQATAKRTGERGQFHLLYPNTGINVFPGPANLSIGPISPSGAGRTERYLDYFFAPDADSGWREEFFAFDDQVGREDTALVESVHRGMASGVLDHGRLLLNAEPLLAAFQSWVSESIR